MLVGRVIKCTAWRRMGTTENEDGLLTACRLARLGRRHYSQYGRCPSTLARRSGQVSCIAGKKGLVSGDGLVEAGKATYDCGRRPLGFQSRSSSSSVMLAVPDMETERRCRGQWLAWLERTDPSVVFNLQEANGKWNSNFQARLSDASIVRCW